MPELPEVEIVCRNLKELLSPPAEITAWNFFRKDLRYIIPQRQLRKTVGLSISGVSRRAKYILIELGSQVIISHLGMTGSWRRETGKWKARSHDHLYFSTNSGDFVFNDPRRFGFIETLPKETMPLRFKNLGIEPLDPRAEFDELSAKLKKMQTPVKAALMNQKHIVGIGNIYASEILFRAKVSPLRKCSRIRPAEWQGIWSSAATVLSEAIRRGGSTIDDYRNGYGEQGEFQNEFFVYGRERELCKTCHTLIKQKTMAGRSTFWCPTCQK